MKKYFFYIIILIMIVLPVTAQTGELDELNEAKNKADEIRERAIDFECASYFPSEWEKAEELYAEASTEPSVSKYNSAEEAFNSIFELAVPLIAQAKEDEIMALRGKLKNAGIDKLFPQYLEPADQKALEAFAKFEDEDYYSAKGLADEALLMFLTLADAHKAWLLREDIIEGSLNDYDPDNFDLADETLASAMYDYLEMHFPIAAEKIEEAAKIYNSILSDGWKKVSEITPSEDKVDLAEAEPETEPETAAAASAEAAAETSAEAVAEAETETAAAASAEAIKGDDIISLPATFKVRPWAASRDCFWNIAALPEVYGDPNMWRVLYNANKSKLPNPENPDLIAPDTVLDIPPIKGETRQGAWESGKKYDALR